MSYPKTPWRQNPPWLRHAILTFQSPDILKFLGRLTTDDHAPANVLAEMTTFLKRSCQAFVSILDVVEEPANTHQILGEAFDQPMFRAMKEDGDSYPLVGRSGRMLGVRVEGPYRDLPVDEDGAVAPGIGGMSVALEKAANL